MNTTEIIRQLEALIAAEKAKVGASENIEEKNKTISRDEERGTTIHQENTSFWHYLLGAIKAPFLFFIKFFKIEITNAIKHDMQRTGYMVFLSVILFVFAIVLWIAIQCVIVFLLIAQNFSGLNAVLISLGFQILCFLIVIYKLYSSYKHMETMNVIRRFKRTVEDEAGFHNKTK
ncbi:MAG: hypothetical protein HOP11_12150 [Saprospiraceae bacterium]|nr:hypothetical protein [Saprospiraceae bacterium]